MSIESHRINQRNWMLRNPDYIPNWKRENRDRILEQRKPRYKQEWLKHREAAAKVRAARMALIQEAKNRPCMDCGIQYPPFIMHFDHRDPATKTKSVSQMTTHSVVHIQEEIAKCDVVCANCHGIRTYNGITTGKIKILGRYYAIK